MTANTTSDKTTSDKTTAPNAHQPEPEGAPNSPPALSAHALVPARDVDVRIDVASGRVVAVLGRNGAGKSTLIDVIAGLLDPGNGHVRIAGRPMMDANNWVPARNRGIALLAQRPLLFPHLSVLENVAFGPRSAGTRRKAARELAQQALTDAGIAEFAHRRPDQLSEGQAQRVALARALAPNPGVVLLDEPLASLDVDSAAQIRLLLAQTIGGGQRTAVLVTHNLTDVLALADDVLVVEAGRVVEAGPVAHVVANPQSAFMRSVTGHQGGERPA